MRFIPVFCFLLLACSGSSVPKGVLPQDKMQDVLFDVIRGDEMVDFLKLSDSTWQPFERRTALYDTIFHLHEVKKEIFQNSLRFYQERPDLLKDILEELQKRITDTSAATGKPLKQLR
jgi:hypothetical protein